MNKLSLIDRYNLWKYLIETQLREVRLAEGQLQQAKELADIVLICKAAIKSLGMDPENTVRTRENENGHKDKEHYDKYYTMFHLNMGDLCQICGKVVMTEGEIKYLVCAECYKHSLTGDSNDS